MTDERNFKYYAFISYSHKDQDIAKRLRKFLEHYNLPANILKSHPDLPKKLNPVFMDESNLVGVSLHDALRENLELSNYLIVICSPDSARSEYVNDEINYFIELGRVNRIIPLIIDGVPHAQDENLECFAKALLNLPREQEPLGIDLKKFGTRRAFLRVIATLLKLDLDYFVSWIDRLRRRRNFIYAAAAAASIIIFGISILYAVQTSKKHADVILINTLFSEELRPDYTERKYGYSNAFKWHRQGDRQDLGKTQANLNSGGEVKPAQDDAKTDEQLQIAALQGQAVEWLQKNASQDNVDELYKSAQMYENKHDYKQAAELYEKAAALGNANAQNELGDLYYYGQIGDRKNYKKAEELYQKAAAQGHVWAQFNLGVIYRSGGYGIKRDVAKAVEWYRRAADNGHSWAQNNLGVRYLRGQAVKRDYKKAFELFTKSAEQGYSRAQFNLAKMYEGGQGIKQDFQAAYMYYYLAYLSGNKKAQEALKSIESGLNASQIAEAKAQAEKKFKEIRHR